MENKNAWWQGYYIYIAHATALSNAFKKKGAKADEYPKEPLRIFPKTKEELEEEERENTRKTIEFLDKMKKDWDRRKEEN